MTEKDSNFAIQCAYAMLWCMDALRNIEEYRQPDLFVLQKAHPESAMWRNLFLRAIRQFGTVRNACDTLGIDSIKTRKLLRIDPELQAGVEDAMEDIGDMLEGEVYRRAMNGSDLLLMFALKKHKSSFKENQPVQSITINNTKTYVGFDPDAWDKLSQKEEKVLDITPDKIMSSTPLLEENSKEKLTDGTKSSVQ